MLFNSFACLLDYIVLTFVLSRIIGYIEELAMVEHLTLVVLVDTMGSPLSGGRDSCDIEVGFIGRGPAASFLAGEGVFAID